MFFATRSHDLGTLTFDLLTLRVPHVQCFSCLSPNTNFYYHTTIGYWVTSTEYLITFPLSVTVTAHAPCHVASNRLKIVHIFEIPDFNLPVHFVTFTALRRRLSHVIGKNSVYQLWRLQSLLRMRSITWPAHRRSPKTKRNNFFYPELPIHYTTFTGLRWRLRVGLVYIGASPC